MSFWNYLWNPVSQVQGIGHGFQKVFQESGRLTNRIEDKLPNWIPTSWRENIAGKLNPLAESMGAVGNLGSDYYSARQQGMSPTDARQFSTNNMIRTGAAVGAGALGGWAYGAAGAGGAGALGSSGGAGSAGVVGDIAGSGSAGLGSGIAGSGAFGTNAGIVAGDVAGSGAGGLGSGLGGTTAGSINASTAGGLGTGGSISDMLSKMLKQGGQSAQNAKQQEPYRPDNSLLAYILASGKESQIPAPKMPAWSSFQ